MGRNGLGGAGRGTPHSVSGAAHNRVLVVAASPINRIVISRMIERIYMKSVAVTPEAALDALKEEQPMMVIIDEGRQPELLQPVISELARQREAAAGSMPRVILIVEPSRQGETGNGGTVDAVIVKPITPEVLQPIVERLARDGTI